MASKTYFFTGTAKWAKFKTPDKYGKYSLDLYMDKENLDQYKKSGIQSQVKADDDGAFVSFKRLHEQVIKGENVEWGPPKVVLLEGKDDEGKPVYTSFDGLVGNGSVVTCRVLVYDGARGKGQRLEAVGIEKLVEFNPGDQSEFPF